MACIENAQNFLKALNLSLRLKSLVDTGLETGANAKGINLFFFDDW